MASPTKLSNLKEISTRVRPASVANKEMKLQLIAITTQDIKDLQGQTELVAKKALKEATNFLAELNNMITPEEMKELKSTHPNVSKQAQELRELIKPPEILKLISGNYQKGLRENLRTDLGFGTSDLLLSKKFAAIENNMHKFSFVETLIKPEIFIIEKIKCIKNVDKAIEPLIGPMREELAKSHAVAFPAIPYVKENDPLLKQVDALEKRLKIESNIHEKIINLCNDYSKLNNASNDKKASGKIINTSMKELNSFFKMNPGHLKLKLIYEDLLKSMIATENKNHPKGVTELNRKATKRFIESQKTKAPKQFSSSTNFMHQVLKIASPKEILAVHTPQVEPDSAISSRDDDVMAAPEVSSNVNNKSTVLNYDSDAESTISHYTDEDNDEIDFMTLPEPPEPPGIPSGFKPK